MHKFARLYATVYSKTKREIYAHFEIGCLLALVKFYEKNNFTGEAKNKSPDGSYRYLTTPNGNPANFSYLVMTRGTEQIEIRQQVRVVSHIGSDIAFTPDLVVLQHKAPLKSKKDPDYAGGKRSFFYVLSEDVIAIHECKSMPPFPELLVSFVGTLIVGHKWIERENPLDVIADNGTHLAPSLFVGGSPRALHLRLINGLKSAYPINIIVGLHAGTWDLFGNKANVQRMINPLKASKTNPAYYSQND